MTLSPDSIEGIIAIVYIVLTIIGLPVGAVKVRGLSRTQAQQTTERDTDTATIAALIEERDERKMDFEKLQQQIAELIEKTAKLETDFADAQKRVEEQSTLIDLHETTIAKYDTRLKEAHDTVARELSRADKADGIVGELRAEIVVLDKREDKSQSNIIGITMKLRDRNAECTLKDSEINNLKARIRELEKPTPPPKPPASQPDIKVSDFKPQTKDDDDQQERKIA